MSPGTAQRATAVVFLCAVLMAACSGSGKGPSSTPSSPAQATATGTAVATENASPSNATPAPTGQLSARFDVAFPQLPELERPTNMVAIPGAGRILIALQDGRLLSFANDPGADQVATVLDWRSKTSRGGQEEGFLGLALDPAFGQNGYIYIYYNAKPGDRRTVLSRLATSGSGDALRADPASELILLTVPQPYANHNGGQLAFGPDGMLYLGLGDGGSGGDPSGNGQDLKRNLLGSIIRIDVQNATKDQPYAIPPDNPFATSPNGEKPETWAYGLRNPWRFSWDRDSGLMVAADVGQGDYEEVDIIEKGQNYGWGIMEGKHCYKPKSGCDQSGLTLPIVEYTHDGGACSVTGGYVYHGAQVRALTGAYLYADYCTGEVWALPSIGTDPNPQPVVLQEEGPSISSFAEDESGEVYLLGFDGKIYRVNPA